MFTGLVQATGAIVAVRPLQAGVHIEVDARALTARPVRLGDSVAVNGVCLTATEVDGGRFGADVSRETLSKTTGLDRPGLVNLESSLALGDVLGGHLVSGHVDGVGRIARLAPAGESVELVVHAPLELARYFAPKGSVAVDGVSLTINRVQDEAGDPPACALSINLIPHTVAHTAFREAREGQLVNLEVDLVARYVARMLQR